MIVVIAMETSNHVNLVADVLRALQRLKALKFAPSAPLVQSVQIAPSKLLVMLAQHVMLAILVQRAIPVKFVKFVKFAMNVVQRATVHLTLSAHSVLLQRSGKRRLANHAPAKSQHQLPEIVDV